MRFTIILFVALAITAVLISGCSSVDRTNTTINSVGDSEKDSNLTANYFYELQADGAIVVTGKGTSIQRVRIMVQNMGNRTLSFTIPIGACLLPGESGYQTMITTEAYKVTLAPQQQEEVVVPAACTNIHRKIPGSSVNFIYVLGSPNDDLVLLLRNLDKSDAEYSVIQAAVWIITDDADWNDLGTLTSGAGSASGRKINENNAAEAMRAIDESGLSIKERAIWEDRRVILSGITNPSLASWLKEYTAMVDRDKNFSGSGN